MNVTTFETTNGTIIDAKDSLSPIPAIKLKSALKKEPEHTVVGIATTEADAELNIRDFCTTTGNLYLGKALVDGHEVHYIKKQIMTCETCSNTRIVIAGAATLGVLAYTSPQVVIGDPSPLITLVFLAALLSMPPLLINNSRLVRTLFRKAVKR